MVTVITAVPAVAPEGADTVTVLPEKATVARAGTDDATVNTLLSASTGAMFTVNVVLEPAAIELLVGVTVTPVTAATGKVAVGVSVPVVVASPAGRWPDSAAPWRHRAGFHQLESG